jgi:negative regulator of genetic competence, sporulation and motility
MLDKSEMKKFGLDKEDLDYNEPEVRNSFWKILDIAASECGFKCKGEKILIQFYPAKSGGEIFITKLGLLSKNAENSLAASQRVAMLSSELKIYKFDDLYSIATAVHINGKSLPEKIRAYTGEGGEYYLIFEERNEKAHVSILEFATKVPNQLEAYIPERTSVIENPYMTLEKAYQDLRRR